MYAQDSIELLTTSGIQFKKHEDEGIETLYFAELLMTSGVVLCDGVKWLSFHRYSASVAVFVNRGSFTVDSWIAQKEFHLEKWKMCKCNVRFSVFSVNSGIITVFAQHCVQSISQFMVYSVISAHTHRSFRV